mmetsp:Transcript_2945/g.4409  ORF Transcript_2945/g.4409 Transcript_2945/m.4409 type:complete len:645 (-) Transcript_2945:37-1971(-)
MGNMPIHDYFLRPTNKAFHDLTSTLKPPPNLRSLLGLGLGFIPTPYNPTSFNKLESDTSGAFQHLERSLRLRCFFTAKGQPEPAPNWNPKFHIPSEWIPDEKFFPKVLPRRLHQFKIRLRQLFRGRKSIPNLSREHRFALDYLRRQTDFIVAICDKGLGPAIIEYDKYIELAFRDHLNDTSTYQRLCFETAGMLCFENKQRLEKWIDDHSTEVEDTEMIYIKSKMDEVKDPMPYFYLLMKVHKKPLKTRPIVSFSGSLFHSLGVWIDVQLQQVANTLTSYLKSSFDLVEIFKTFRLPPNRRCRLFTADATSMYTNIDTEAATQAIHDYIMNNSHLFPTVPLVPLVEAIDILMNTNVFQFGDTFWLQLTGVAMGAPPAPNIATISYGTHEENFLPKFQANLGFYKRYIDDVFGVWICDEDPITDERRWNRFKRKLNDWHGLEWTVSERLDTAVFLDLNLSITGNSIHSSLYEKENNLHLFLPARSAHPPGVLYGLIAGSVHRAFSLCTDRSDAIDFLRRLLRHLIARGYSKSSLTSLFQKAIQNYQSRATDDVSSRSNTSDHWLFKLTYHPQDPPSKLIQHAWNTSVAEPRLSKPLKDLDILFRPLGHRRLIVCYRRPANLGNLLSYRKISPDSGRPVSSFCEEL